MSERVERLLQSKCIMKSGPDISTAFNGRRVKEATPRDCSISPMIICPVMK
ncbi:hypothetical protein Mapa_007565 [Marchantia paleacea]|nr:hypothetical protein Mapa_007565 [Marchantia paleacea]